MLKIIFYETCEDVGPKPGTQDTLSSPFTSRMGEDVLPFISLKKAEIVVSLGSSTRRRKICLKKGLVRTPEEDRDVHTSRAMADDLSQGINQITHEKSKSESAAFGATESL